MADIHSEEEVHERLARELGRKLDPVIWEQLRDDGYVEAACEDWGGAEFDDLVGAYRRLARFAKRYGKTASNAAAALSRPRALAAQLAPLEELLALEAAREEAVVHFRNTILGGQLLANDQVQLERDWFLAHVRDSRRLSSRGGAIHTPRRSPGGEGGVRRSLVATQKAIAGYLRGRSQLHGANRADDELDYLHCLVECLMAGYGWGDVFEVERFVLCGATPHLGFVSARLVPSERYPQRTSQIVLTVHQRTSPAQLRFAFALLKPRLCEAGQLPGRQRACSQKTAALALHVARYNDGRSWRAMMRLWNEARPDDAYDDPRAFARRCHAAYLALTGDALVYRGGTRRARPAGRVTRRRLPHTTRLIPAWEYREVIERALQGEPLEAIAGDYGVKPTQVLELLRDPEVAERADAQPEGR